MQVQDHVATGFLPVAIVQPASRLGVLVAARWAAAARGACLAFIACVVVLFAAAIPVRFAQLVSTFQNLSPAQELVLRDLGVSGVINAGLIFGIELAVASAFVAIGILILSKRPNDPVALYVAAALPAYAAWVSPSVDALAAAPGPFSGPAAAVQALGFVTTITFFYIFPTGRFVPSWTALIVPSLVTWALGWLIFSAGPFDLSNLFRLPMSSFALLMAWLASGVAAQLYRYVRVATPVQRQQSKLILFGACVGVAGYLLFGFDRFAMPMLREARVAGVVYDLVGVPLFLLTVLAVPVSFAISILRYRLWEIEELLGRAFVYTLLTALLGGTYTAAITLSQRVFVALTGEKSDAALVITTLVVASSFIPLRNALQGLADRNVKHKPDPTSSLKAFTSQVRAFVEDIDVEQLARRGLEEAARAFGASSGAAYLRRDGHFQAAHVHGAWDQVEGMSAWLDSEGARYGWLTLGPRAGGQPYTAHEEAAFREMVALIARAMWLLGRSDFSRASESGR